ncbi:MAG TPA: hypothetical protein VFE20_06285 [Thermoleophilia bacterium]|nr:hypothetical protein [Thermoleophilia bacterium]
MTVFRTKSRAAILAVALVGVFLLGSSELEAHTFTANSTVSIRFHDGKFKGRVRSPRERCEKRRLVKVYKARPNRPDVFIGEDRTNDNGFYRVRKPRGVKGKFYARATRKVTQHPNYPTQVHRCRRALSRVIKAP